ncbi:MAG TPA: alpha/beta fold hydrolase [Candidatus Dormibacteraeota bacterium]|nr:alpha/beta fold hydrolase [Candidatus Dormibacteraeota bacterium]
MREPTVTPTAVTEQARAIPVPGTDKVIHGLLREVPGAPLVVLVHCLTGWKNSTKYYLGARALERAGFSSFRFDLYGYADDARKLLDCTVATHADDLDLVLAVLREEQPDRPISVIGHSLGGLTILCSRRQGFDAVVLWDATHSGGWQPRQAEEHADPAHPYGDESTVWEGSLDCYRLRWGCDILVSEAMLRSYRDPDCNALISQLHRPVKVIAAGANAFLRSVQNEYYEHANEPKALAVIEGADHNFETGETMVELFAETVRWLDQHGRQRCSATPPPST